MKACIAVSAVVLWNTKTTETVNERQQPNYFVNWPIWAFIYFYLKSNILIGFKLRINQCKMDKKGLWWWNPFKGLRRAAQIRRRSRNPKSNIFTRDNFWAAFSTSSRLSSIVTTTSTLRWLPCWRSSRTCRIPTRTSTCSTRRYRSSRRLGTCFHCFS